MTEANMDSRLTAEPLEWSELLLADASSNVEGLTGLHNDSTTSDADGLTVSPHDVFYQHTLSAPNSNALTNMTTPSMAEDDSPDVPGSFDCSPMFESHDVGNNNNWFPLFESNELRLQNSSDQDVSSFTDSFTNNSYAMARTASNNSANENKADVLRHRVSVSAGVNKSRRAVKNLAPIDVDENDSKAAKRAKNTMAARKSRQKKRDIEDSLRIALDAMTADRDHWRHMAIAHGAPVPEMPNLS